MEPLALTFLPPLSGRPGTLLALVLALCGTPGLAQEQSYSWTDPTLQAMDAACLSSSKTPLQSDFDGSAGLENQMPQYWSDAMPGVAIFIYPHTKFLSSFGEVDGSITCLFDVQKQAVVNIGFQFDGKGLASYKKSPLAKLNMPPEQLAVTFFATSLSNANGGN